MADADPQLERLAALEAENERLRAELESVRSEGRFVDSLLEHVPLMIFVKDAKELRFVRFNQAGEQLLGFTRDAMLGKNDHDFFPPDEAEFFVSKDREVLTRGALLDIPEEMIHTGRGPRWLHTRKIPILDERGEPTFLLGISEDITERREAEAELERRTAELTRALADLQRTEAIRRDREQQLGLLLERFPGAVWTTDGELRIRSVAGARAGLLGLGPDAAVGEPLVEHHVTPGPGADLSTMLRQALAGEPVTYEVETRDAVLDVRVERRGESAADGLIGVALDVTERRRLETERLRDRIERTQKLEILGLLAGGIAHDFNNHLTVILGNASLAVMRLPEDAPALKPIRRVEQSAQSAADLTRQLLAYSGRGRFIVEPLDLSTLVEEMAGLLRVTIPRTTRLEFDLARGLPCCEADAAQLRQVLVNLITNAAEAIGEAAGRITLATGSIQADRDYLTRTWLDEDLPEGNYVWFEVSDTGVGMDAALQREIFEPRCTTKNRGLGLGLCAALGIVRGHRGAIRVYSEVGRGTSMKVLFPAVRGEKPRARPVSGPGPAEAPHSRVLVVDDEPDIRIFARDALEGAGFEVTTAEDGVDAVERFTADPARFQVVLLDMTMPRMNGEETFRELRRIRPGVRVLLSSGFNEQEATARFVGKGLAGFLQKPYTAGTLIDRIRALVND